jgi:hypothetical protein
MEGCALGNSLLLVDSSNVCSHVLTGQSLNLLLVIANTIIHGSESIRTYNIFC